LTEEEAAAEEEEVLHVGDCDAQAVGVVVQVKLL